MKKCKVCKVEILPKRTYCSNKCKFSDVDYNKSRITHIKNRNDKHIKCKICDYTSSDEKNKSGCLTRHLNSHGIGYDNVFDHFDIIDYVANSELWNCPLCSWNTKDISNKSGCITSHIKNTHNLSVTDFMLTYSNNGFSSKEYRLSNRFLSEDDYIECKLCSEKLSIISNTHCLNIHGITQEQYKTKYGDDIISKNLSKVLQKCGGSKSFTSKGELEIIEYLTGIGMSDIVSGKLMGGYEIDIFLEKYNIGIEFDGLYWHSELRGRGSKYHLDKTEYFNKKGIRIIHIFDDEWNNKTEIVKYKLSHILGVSTGETIYARKCEVHIIDSKTSSNFLNKNHIQGSDKSNVRLGLYSGEVLVSVATFSKKRNALGYKIKVDGEYELSRYATSNDIRVVGGVSKLLKHFITNYKPTSIISYADRRYSDESSMYSKIGFSLVGKTKPNYYYTNNYTKRLHRYNFTKHRIVNQLGGDKSLSEWENMMKMGYDRVWDCGSLKYELIIG
jgi:hypothetical protein